MGNGSDVGKFQPIWGIMMGLPSENHSGWSVSIQSVCLSALSDLAFRRALPHGSSRPGLLHGEVMLPLWGPAQRSALGGFAESPFNHWALCQQCSSLWPSGFQMTVLPDVLVCIFYKLKYTIPSWLSQRPQSFFIWSPCPPPIFSATSVINVLSNVFSWNCDYAQAISKLFIVITGKSLGDYELCMWSELLSGPWTLRY